MKANKNFRIRGQRGGLIHNEQVGWFSLKNKEYDKGFGRTLFSVSDCQAEFYGNQLKYGSKRVFRCCHNDNLNNERILGSYLVQIDLEAGTMKFLDAIAMADQDNVLVWDDQSYHIKDMWLIDDFEK